MPTFLPSYFSKYLCLFVFIRGFLYSLSYFSLFDSRLCLKASYITTAPAADAFRESKGPVCGIESNTSQCFFTSGRTPFPSPPMTMALNAFISQLNIDSVEILSIPAIHNPFSLSILIVLAMFVTREREICSKAPADTLDTVGVG
jgi:hypothetical protein